jgi:hypothetical protein
MADVHYSFADLSGLGKRVQDAAVNSVQRHWMQGFGAGVPAIVPTNVPLNSHNTSVPPPDLTYARNMLSMVPELYSSFAGPSPDSCGAVIGQVNAVRQAVGDNIPTQDPDQAPAGSWRPSPTIAPTLNRVYNQATGWEGGGAQAFGDYIDNLRGSNCIIDHQSNVGTVLTVGLRAHQDILTRAYQDIWSIGEETIKVLDAGGTGGCTGPSGNIVLQIVSGIAWVAGAAATDGAALALTALAAAAGSTGGFLPPEKHTTIHGTTMLSVISTMSDAIGTLLTWIGNQQALVVKNLTTAAHTATTWYKATGPNGAGLYPPPPKLFSQPGGWTPG